jgi:Leucine-rich repeat (LRR) protein
MGALRSLNSLAMDGNMLVGSIPASLLGLQLWYLNLSGNGLSGPLPTGAGNAFPSMVSMDLSHNRLTGDIGQLFRSLSTAASHGNRITTPQIVLAQKLEHLDVSENRITGALPDFDRGAGLRWLDISGNAIGGQIPSSVSKLSGLERLDVSRNRVRGTIPASMAEMVRLRWLDLSMNELVGRIPDNFTRLTGVRHASFRGNRLCGQIPQARPFNLFREAAYAHNLCLCGKPLPPCRKIR